MSAAPTGTPPPSALPSETRCGFKPERGEVERAAGAAEAALDFVRDEERAGLRRHASLIAAAKAGVSGRTPPSP